MKVAMVFPTRESEKAISGYSINLVEAIREKGIEIDEQTYKSGSLKSFRKLIPSLKKYDFVHIQHEYNLLGGYGIPFFFAYRKLKSLKKPKIVTTMHTALSQKEKYSEFFLKTFFRNLLYRFQNRLINKVSDSIIVHSDFFVPILVKEYGFSRKKLTVLPQGIIEDIPTITKNRAKKELGLKGNVHLIIGNLTPDSGADIPLKYANQIGKTILVVSSPRPVNDRRQKRLAQYLEEIKNLVKKRNSSEYVQFDIKNISDEMPLWWKYFSAADFVLQAYRGAIGSGIFTHAMATKTPVIASNIPFFKDISKEYECIKIVEKEEDYPQIIKDSLKKKNYYKMVKECRRYLKERSWSAIAEEYKKLYKSLK